MPPDPAGTAIVHVALPPHLSTAHEQTRNPRLLPSFTQFSLRPCFPVASILAALTFFPFLYRLDTPVSPTYTAVSQDPLLNHLTTFLVRSVQVRSGEYCSG